VDDSPLLESRMEQIKCSFIPIREFSCLPEKENEEFKLGRYHGSSFYYGEKQYPIAARIQLDDAVECINEETFKKCINFLNKKRKNQKKPIYGNLIGRTFEVKEDSSGIKFISALLTTDAKNVKYFWGKGK
jgi:hypothetical protein